MWQVFWSALEKIFCLGVQVFVSDVISGGLLGHLGPLCLTLGTNCGSISLKFLLETRLQSSLLILWMTCWGLRFKSYFFWYVYCLLQKPGAMQ